MRYQQSHFSCGPNAVQNALEVHGIIVEQTVIEAIAETTPEGTSEKGIIRAIKHWGKYPQRIYTRSPFQGICTIDVFLSASVPVILCVDNWKHWVVVVGAIGKKYVVSDGADVNYVQYMDREQLIKRWERKPKWFYGLAVV